MESSGDVRTGPPRGLAKEPDLSPALLPEWNNITADVGSPMAELALHAREGLAACSDESVRRIHATIPAYRHGAQVDAEDLWWSLYRNNELLLVLLWRGGVMTQQEREARYRLGVRRARQGMQLTDVMRAFRIGYSVLWESVLQRARALGDEVTNLLVDKGVLLWATLDEVSSEVAEAHMVTTSALDTDIRRRSTTLLAGIREWPDQRAATEAGVRAFGMDPAGVFLVAVHDSDVIWNEYGTAVTVESVATQVVLTEVDSEDAISERILVDQLRKRGVRRGGIGLPRRGVGGARMSLADAERAFHAAAPLGGGLIRFREHWIGSLAMDLQETLQPVASGLTVLLRGDDALRSTVDAVLACDGNLRATGELLNLQPNSVAYRVSRIEELTGVDVRTMQGAAIARLALTYVFDGDS